MAAEQPDDLMIAVETARERAVEAVARLRHAHADFVTVRETVPINSDAYGWSNHAAGALNGAASSMEHAARTLSGCAESGTVHPGVVGDLADDMDRLLENMRALFRTVRTAVPQDPSSPVLWMDKASNALSDDLVASVMNSYSAAAQIASIVGSDFAWDLIQPRRDGDYSAAHLEAAASVGMLDALLLGPHVLGDSTDDLATDISATGT